MTDIPFELQILSQAKNYQKWIADTILPYLGESILEVGAGIGNQSRWLPIRKNLIITEASANLFPTLQENLKLKFGQDPRLQTDLVNLDIDWTKSYTDKKIDTIVSFNVLEHVEDDASVIQSFLEILKANTDLTPKRIVTFVPAHQWAFGTVDTAYGHYRRYSHKNFLRILESHKITAKTYYRYFNLFGLPGWLLMNKVLRRTEIGLGAVKSFEQLCPLLKPSDNFLSGTLRIPMGQSLLFVIEV